MGVLCTWVKLLTDLQILGCELHKSAFGDRTPPGPSGGDRALTQPPNRYKGKGRGGRRRKGEEGKDVKWKGEMG